MKLWRLQNADVYKLYFAQRSLGKVTDETVMFHGCRTQDNEDSIKRIGFQVSCCKSGGSNFGTWFAYNANYSDSGYVYSDVDSWRHIFVCVVSRMHVVKDDP